METSEEILTTAKQLVREWAPVPGAAVQGVEPLDGDVSSRAFFRILLEKCPITSTILMQLAGGESPFGGGEKGIDADRAFVEVHAYLSDHGIPVPDLYLALVDHGYLLVEDLGDRTLLALAEEGREDPGKRLEAFDGFYRAADFLCRLQQLPVDRSCVAFQRSPTFEMLFRGTGEFVAQLLEAKGLQRQEKEVLTPLFQAVCEEVRDHPKVFSHHDFMPNNLMISESGEITLIDFQDASYDSPARDLHALLFDRGTDAFLGKERIRECLQRYFKTWPGSPLTPRQMREYGLHWDLRVAGRFQFLVEERGKSRYAQYIAGTVSRIGRHLIALQGCYPKIEDSFEILRKYLPSIGDTSQDPWDIFPQS